MHQKWQLFHTLTYYPIKNTLCHQFSNTFYQERGGTRLILILDLCCASAVSDDVFSDDNKESLSIVLILVQIIQLRWWLYRHQGHYAQERWRRTLYIRRAEHSWTMRRGEVRNNAETGKSISSSSVWWIITELSHKLQCTYLWWQVAVSQCSYPAYQE